MGTRVLIVATVPLESDQLDSVVDVQGADIHVVATASKLSPVDWPTNDEGGARRQAEVSAERTAGAAPNAARVGTEVGDVDPLQAAEDALRMFPANELVVVVAPEDEASWLERASVDGFERFGLPVRYVRNQGGRARRMSAARDLGTVSCRTLIGRPVPSRSILLGRVADVLFSRDGTRCLGMEIDCQDGDRRFLPLAATHLDGWELTTASPHALVEAGALPYYREKARSLLSLVGTHVVSGAGTPVGPVEDVVVRDSGEVEHLVVRQGTSTARVPPYDLRLPNESGARWET